MYWAFYMLIQQVLNIQALVLGFETERSTLLVVMCDFMWRKNELFELLKGNVDLQIDFCLVLT